MKQNYFEALGANLTTICGILLKNQKLIKLLSYGDKDPLSHSDFEDTGFAMDKHIGLTPEIPEVNEGYSLINILVDEIATDGENATVNNLIFVVDVICPVEQWKIAKSSLRPFSIMGEVLKNIDGIQLESIGKLHFKMAERTTYNEYYTGYKMIFLLDEQN